MGASSQGGQMNPQGAQIRPQGQQQRPMGGQGKGPGLPMPQQGGDRPFQPKPYQPIGANNPPFNPNPVQPVPGNMPQGKGPGQGQISPQMADAIKNHYMQQMQNGNPMGPGAPMKPQVMPMSPGGGYPMPPQRTFVGQGNDMPMQPIYRGPDSFGNMPPNQGKGPM